MCVRTETFGEDERTTGTGKDLEQSPDLLLGESKTKRDRGREGKREENYQDKEMIRCLSLIFL